MPSLRKLKREQSRQFARSCITLSVAPGGDIFVRLPGRRKTLQLTRVELGFIQALPMPLDPKM
jgi:hypothetical protein